MRTVNWAVIEDYRDFKIMIRNRREKIDDPSSREFKPVRCFRFTSFSTRIQHIDLSMGRDGIVFDNYEILVQHASVAIAIGSSVLGRGRCPLGI